MRTITLEEHSAAPEFFDGPGHRGQANFNPVDDRADFPNIHGLKDITGIGGVPMLVRVLINAL